MLKAILIDDEYYALQMLKTQLNKLGKVEILGMYEDADEGIAGVKAQNPDIVFLDIDMGSTNGLNAFTELMEYNAMLSIVFVTAYDKFAVDAFELDALDYIVKPVRVDRLKKTLDRIEKERSLPAGPRQLTIECFGGFSIKLNGRTVSIPWRTKKSEEILAYIALKKGDFVSKEKVAAVLWQKNDMEKSKSNFYYAYHFLTKQMSLAGVRPPIESIRGKIRLKTEDITLDILEFESAVKAGDKQSLKKAKDLYKGALFDGMYYEWSVVSASMYEQMYENL